MALLFWRICLARPNTNYHNLMSEVNYRYYSLSLYLLLWLRYARRTLVIRPVCRHTNTLVADQGKGMRAYAYIICMSA